jgi:murE/murF fusion protein
MKSLHQLLLSLPAELSARIVQGTEHTPLAYITCDSRTARENSLFVAVRGNSFDGHDALNSLLSQGCTCVVVEKPLCTALPEQLTVVQVKDSRSALAWLAAAFYDFPGQNLTLIGLTGTNGKTTVSWLLEQSLQAAGLRVGVLGTVNYRWPAANGELRVEDAPLTTPEPLLLQRLLRDMVQEGVSHVIMETSSHALYQGRLEGLHFDVALFTNLTRDHLDFHGTMEAYYQAKKLLFRRLLRPQGRAVLVLEQEQEQGWGHRLQQELHTERPDLSLLLTCGLDPSCTLSALGLEQDMQGFSCTLRVEGLDLPLTSQLTGPHNVLNVLAAIGVGLALDLPKQELVAALGRARQVPGRLQRVQLPGCRAEEQPCVLVDYAHTPDALDKVLQGLRPLVQGRLLCLFGCGGDRDKGKRPLMGAVAARYADLVIISTDNPRSEDPEQIITEVAAGCREAGLEELTPEDVFSGKKGFICMTERRPAIHCACSLAKPQDVLLLAGKGHEEYQIMGKEQHFFSDTLEALRGLLAWTPEHLLLATGGRLCHSGKPQLLGQISTDTRSLQAGDIFVALAGERHDGHDWIQAAQEAGAAALIVHRRVEAAPEVLVIQVPDTLEALLALAGYRRRLLGKQVTVVGITGSCGKTTVKELVAALCEHHWGKGKEQTSPVLKTQGNHNNLIGLPLSLLPLSAEHRVAVLEMGMNHFGEIARLTASAAPDIACITNVQAAHLEGLGSIQGVAQAKGELFAGLCTETVSVINCDDPLVRRLPTPSRQVLGFALTPQGRRLQPKVYATHVVDQGERGMRFTLHIEGWKERLSISLPGRHSVSNCCAAATIAYAAGLPPATIAQALTAYTNATDKRMQSVQLAGGIHLLNDCYNANPGSMSAALQTLRGFGPPSCQHVALLGDMLELGEAAAAAHEQLGREAAELGYDQVAVVGRFADQLAQGAAQAGLAAERIHVFKDIEAMASWLQTRIKQGELRAGDWLLLKGSRGMRMERVVEALHPSREEG